MYGDANRQTPICAIEGASHASKPRPVGGGGGAAVTTGVETAKGSVDMGTPPRLLHPGHEPSLRSPQSWKSFPRTSTVVPVASTVAVGSAVTAPPSDCQPLGTPPVIFCTYSAPSSPRAKSEEAAPPPTTAGDEVMLPPSDSQGRNTEPASRRRYQTRLTEPRA